MKAWAPKKSGFTIVELLIVIVVIAVLAAITIVAFNGIQTRAENNKTIHVVQSYVKALNLYAIDNGSYPSTAVYPCLGTYTLTNCGRMVTGTPGCAYSGTAVYNSAFDTLILPYLGGKKPAGSDQQMGCSGDIYTGTYLNATSANTKAATMRLYLKGDVPCTQIGNATVYARSQSGDTTSCSIALPTLP